MRATRHLQHRVVDKEAHHGVEIVGVEGVNQPLERLDGCLARAGHRERLHRWLIVSSAA
jgi:hypothetical protein